MKQTKDFSWKEFLVLLANLSEDSVLMKVIALRKMNPNDIKDIELKKTRERFLLTENKEQKNALDLFYKNWIKE